MVVLVVSSHCGSAGSIPHRNQKCFSCGLLWLNPKVWGEYLTSLFSLVATCWWLKLFCATLPSERYGSLLRSEIGWDRVEYGLQVWKGGRYRGEVGAVHLSGQRERLKVRAMWCKFLLVDCCGWVVNQDGALYWNLLEIGPVQRGTWVWATRAETLCPGSPHRSRLGYLPWLISCGLLRLNPRA